MNSSSLSLACAAILALTLPATAAPPLGYLRGFGPKSDPVVQLTWGLLALSTLVVVVVTALVVIGTLLRRARGGGGIAARTGGTRRFRSAVDLGRPGHIVRGTAAVTGVDHGCAGGRERAAAACPGDHRDNRAAMVVQKRANLSPDPSRVFTTADEIHIPVGEPVRIRLIGADVIHSFWVPGSKRQDGRNPRAD
ncbi:MAG: hypothetical protein WDN04_18390 [Rhodospirillales bacterium]